MNLIPNLSTISFDGLIIQTNSKVFALIQLPPLFFTFISNC
jgi:hypothetical protein